MDKLKWGMDWHLTAYLEGVWHLSLHLTCNGHSGTTKDDGWNLTLISHGHCPSDTVKWFHNSMLINFQRPISAQISGLVSKIRAPNRLNHKIIFLFLPKTQFDNKKNEWLGPSDSDSILKSPIPFSIASLKFRAMRISSKFTKN